MEYREIISDSIDYSRDALVGNWKTWLVFIICSLPFALMVFLFDPEKLAAGTVDWNAFPWVQFIALILAGFLLSFFTSGYIVRVLRGTKPAPVFDHWGQLYLDGIKLMVVELLWIVPTSIILGAAFVFIMAFTGLGGMTSPVLRILLVLLVSVALIFAIVTILCIIPGFVRFARTGSIREGIRVFALLNTVGAIGLGSYILAFVILMVIVIVFFLLTSVLGLIPFIGWVIRLALSPLIFVFSARYVSRVYDHAAPPAPLVTEPVAGT